MEINGGDFRTINTTVGNKVVDIENSTQVSLTGNLQIDGAGISGTAKSICVYINGRA